MTPEPWWPTFCRPRMKRLVLPTLLLVVSGTATTETPPAIVRQPPHELLFRVPSAPDQDPRPIALQCEAKGDPKPRKRWTKNNKKFNYSANAGRMSGHPEYGPLVFFTPVDEDEGLYQCQASNHYGTSVSNAVFLRKAHLNSFPDQETKNVSVKEGEPFSLYCDPPTGYPRPHVTWLLLHQNGAIRAINSSRITADPDGGLHFTRAEMGDALEDAVYSCSATSTFLNQYNLGNKVRLHVEPVRPNEKLIIAPVKQYLSPKKVVALRGSKVQLQCIYGGTPLNVTSWSKDGVELAFPRFMYSDGNKTLIINSVQFEDEGTYECRVGNGSGPDLKHTMYVKVEAAPYWLSVPNNTHAAVEEGVVFKCDAVGIPKPNLEWFVNGVPIATAKSNRRHTVLGGVLTIEKLEHSDMAVYQCNASNVHGYAFWNFYLKVHAASPTIAEAPENVTMAVMGSRVTLRCRALGAPRPRVIWTKDGRDLGGGRHEELDSGDLHISDLQFTDEGEYACLACAKYSMASAFTTLRVQRRTRITSPPEDLQVSLGKTAMFRCGGETDPQRNLSIEWLVNGELLDLDINPRLVVQTDNTLVVTRTFAHDAGIYTCVARTQLDNDTADATLIVKDVPSPPHLLQVQCDNHVALLEWIPTGESQASILSYRIQHNAGFQLEDWKDTFVNIPATDTQFQVPMSPWGSYRFRVLARNDAGFSKPSETSVMCVTPEDIPYKNPDHVMGRGERSDNLVISWTPMPPAEHNAPGFFYRVLWKRDDLPKAPWKYRHIEDWKQDRLVLIDQPTYKPFRIKVEARNRKGKANSSAAKVVGYSGEDVPLTAPDDFMLVQVVDTRSAEFSWSPVDPETVRGHFRGYKIETWTSEDGEGMRRELVVPTDATTAMVSLFRPYARNLVRLRVFNDKYDGPSSDVVEYLTAEGTPGPVDSLEAIPLGSTALYLAWKEPAEPNGVLTGYFIQYSELRGTQFGPAMERAVPVGGRRIFRAKLVGLKPRTTYNIAIHASTKKGLGEPYTLNTSTGYLSERLPDVPDFSWVHQPDGDKEAIQVTWLPATEGYPGTNFYVQYRRKGDETWETTMLEEYEDNTVVHGLEKAVYEFRVIAVDGKHEQPSKVLEVDTGGLAFLPDPATPKSKSPEQDHPLEASTSEGQPLIGAVERTRVDMLTFLQGAMEENQRFSSALLAALDRQSRALEELKTAVQNGLEELQRSL